MLPYESFFYGGVAFLIGVFAASVGAPPLFVLVSTFTVSALFLLFYWVDGNIKNIWYAGLTIFIVVGSFYYRVDDMKFRAARIPFGKSIEFSGLVVNDPVRNGDTQEMKVMVTTPFTATVLARIKAGTFAYGDGIAGRGMVENPSDSAYARYLSGQYIRGVMRVSKVQKNGTHSGFAIKSALLSLKHTMTQTFSRILPPEEATFLSGLTIGARGTFSKELKVAMQKSGTTHLVALSGYNISILVLVTMSILLAIMRRRIAFIVTTLAIIAFVIMTGAESSVTRAAIIGFVVLFSRELGRTHDIRNVILFTGLIMILISPKVLVFDVGFQLSFLALLGIVYINPMLSHICGVEEGKEDSLFLWKTNAITTASAQLSTLPILISSFGIFSPISLISNIIILELIPMTMAFGFFMALVAPLSYYAALAFGLIASLFLKFELFLIYFFAHISFPFQFKMSVLLIGAYYSALGFAIWKYKKIIP